MLLLGLRLLPVLVLLEVELLRARPHLRRRRLLRLRELDRRLLRGMVLLWLLRWRLLRLCKELRLYSKQWRKSLGL